MHLTAKIHSMIHVYDHSQLNEGQSEWYNELWNECEQYLKCVPELAVHERQHEQVTYIAVCCVCWKLVTEIAKHCAEGTPMPSEAWLQYQFWLNNPTKTSASQYTECLKVKHIVEARQFKKFHTDVHYVSALYQCHSCIALKYPCSCFFLVWFKDTTAKFENWITPLL